MILSPGSIFKYPDYVHPDNTTTPKLFVIINYDSTTDEMFVCMTTSQDKYKQKENICYSKDGYHYFKSGTFIKETWVLFSPTNYNIFKSSHLINVVGVHSIRSRLTESEFYSLLTCIVCSDDIPKKEIKRIERTIY